MHFPKWSIYGIFWVYMYFIKIGNKHALPKKGAFDRPYSKTKTNKTNSETRAISVAQSPDGGDLHQHFFQDTMNWKILLRSARKYIMLNVCTFLLFSFSFFDVSQSLSYCRWINMVVLESSEYAPLRIIRFTLFTKIISTRVTWGFNVFLENKIINRQ